MRHRVHSLTSAEVTDPAERAGIRMTVSFDYDPADPLAVMITFHGSRDLVTWTIARDLLRDGLAGMSGPGDVAAWTAADNPHRYCLRIQNGARTTVFAFDTHVIEVFLTRTYYSVPVGSEFRAADLDSELDAILGEAA